MTFGFDAFELKKLYFAQYLIYCSEIFSLNVNKIEILFNNRILNHFNIIKLLLFVCLLLYVPSQQLWSLRDGSLRDGQFILSLVTDNNPS